MRKINVLPDFFIGAHAAVAGYKLISRDTGRFITYFPSVDLIILNRQMDLIDVNLREDELLLQPGALVTRLLTNPQVMTAG